MKIHIDVVNPDDVAIEHSLELFIQIELVGSPKEADLVIIDDMKKLVQIYDEKKQFAFFNMGKTSFSPSQSNVHEVGTTNTVMELLKIIGMINPMTANEAAHEVTAAPVLATKEIDGAAWILVIDDLESNRNAAINQLGGNYNMVVADGFDSGREALKARKFDFVLTDCEMPVSTEGALSGKAMADKIGQGIPYGLFLLLEACVAGADTAVVSDLDHHQDAYSAAFDHYSGQLFKINGKKGRLIHARIIDGVKDWQGALDQLMR